MLKIITAPDPILSSLAKPVAKIDQSIKHFVGQMEKTLVIQDDPPGVGLAASQVGKNLSLFIIKISKKAKTMVFINPKILKLKTQNSKLKTNSKLKNPKKNDVKLEGCLSIPRIWGPVKRTARILVKYQDLSGKRLEKWFEGLTAVIIQHEIDHLNGVLFTARALEQNQPLYEEKAGKLEKIE